MTPPPEGGVVDSRRPGGSAGQDVGGTPASRSKTRAAGLGTQPPPVGGGGWDGGGWAGRMVAGTGDVCAGLHSGEKAARRFTSCGSVGAPVVWEGGVRARSHSGEGFRVCLTEEPMDLETDGGVETKLWCEVVVRFGGMETCSWLWPGVPLGGCWAIAVPGTASEYIGCTTSDRTTSVASVPGVRLCWSALEIGAACGCSCCCPRACCMLACGVG